MTHEGFEMPEYLQNREYGSGTMVSFTREKGEVFCAGTCEWVAGLINKDDLVSIITKNVLPC